MPRLVRLTATGSIKVGPSDKPISICACGLSRTFPICDGSHKVARERETDPETLYIYDPDRLVIVATRRDEPPPAPPAQAAPVTP